jgi:hypothetical protein
MCYRVTRLAISFSVLQRADRLRRLSSFRCKSSKTLFECHDSSSSPKLSLPAPPLANLPKSTDGQQLRILHHVLTLLVLTGSCIPSSSSSSSSASPSPQYGNTRMELNPIGLEYVLNSARILALGLRTREVLGNFWHSARGSGGGDGGGGREREKFIDNQIDD